MFDPDPKISGGNGFMFASSIVLALRKLKLKEDENGTKVTDVRGIRSIIKCMKTRYNKPFETCEIHIPWDQGMNPYSGLISLFMKKGLLTKDGQKLQYITLDGEVISKKRKLFGPESLDLIMSEFHQQMENNKVVTRVATDDDDNDGLTIDSTDYEALESE
jgi:RecA/RadA recombinase